MILLLFLVFCAAPLAQGERLSEFVGHYEPLLVKAHWEEETPDHIQSKFRFHAHGRNFSLHVETHASLFHPDFQVIVVEGGKEEVKQVDTKGFVVGYVEGEEGSVVHGYVEDGVLEGVIYSQGYTQKREAVREVHNSVIYKASDVVYNLKHTACSSTESPRLRLIQESAGLSFSYQNQLRRKKRGVNPEKNTCTIRVVADHLFYSNIGQSQDSTEFNDVCLGHLFTYRDFEGTIGLAYVGDSSGNLAGGICSRRTGTLAGSVNLNTGLTSLLNFGRELPRTVSYITVAHEIGHNHGSLHDEPNTDCAPGGTQGNYIMYPSATDGTRPNNKLFSECSRKDMGATIDSNGGCFLPRPSSQECGNGIVEGDEQCDCGSEDIVECFEKDPCCKPGNCTLKDDALCSPEASRCCSTSCDYSDEGTLCLRGDLDEGGCQNASYCNGSSATCPPGETLPDGEPCNFDNNVCDHGVCNGSVCVLYDTTECYCSHKDQLCEVCCVFDEQCISTFDNPAVANTTVQPGYPCRNFTGYCTEDLECVFVDNDDILNDLLDNLKDILFNLTSLVSWIKSNWYWVLAGFAGLIILIVLLQITYCRKKPKKQEKNGQSYGYYQRPTADESTGLLERTTRT